MSARTVLRRVIDEQRVRAGTIRRLLAAFDEQQVQLDFQLALALGAVDPSGPESDDWPEHQPTGQQHACVDAPRAVVRCMGKLELTIDETHLDTWRSGKARALFEYLVAHRGHAVPREVLIEALWPDPDALAAGTSLKVAVHALRQILGESVGIRDSPLTVVVRESSYELKAINLWVDVEEFERLCRLAGQLTGAGNGPAALACYEQAAELYRGDFLEDTWDDWAVFRREGLKDQYLFVLAQLADTAFGSGDFQRCIQFSRLILDKDNCREDTYRTLMICHARLGQFGRVRRWYELCVQTLRAMLEVEPSPETEQVYRHNARAGALGSD